MSEPRSRRQLPPISPKPAASDNELEEHRVKKTKKKKKTPRPHSESADEAPNERSSTRRSQRKQRDSSPRKSGGEEQENLNPASTNGAPPKKKKKKKPPTSSREQLMSGDDGLSEQTPRKKPKKKKKKKTVMSETEEEVGDDLGEFADLREDVVVQDGTEPSRVEQAVVAQPTMRSEPISKVYIEQRGGFKTADKQKLARRREDEAARNRDAQLAPRHGVENTMQLALASHRLYHKMALSLEGLFAGIALVQIIFAFHLSGLGADVFLETYHKLAMPFQSLFFLLFVVSTVDLFDRYDIGRPTSRLLMRAITLQSGALVSVLYVVGLVVSTTTAAIDEKIGQHQYDEDGTLWPSEEARDSQLQTWLILNTIRGVCAILAWIIISLFIKPTTDRLSKNLIKADENQLMMDTTNNPENIMTSVPIGSLAIAPQPAGTIPIGSMPVGSLPV